MTLQSQQNSPASPVSFKELGPTVSELRSQNEGLMGTITKLEQRLQTVEERFREMGYTTKRIVQSQIAGSYTVDSQAETMYGMHIALCVSTIDPLKQNRIRYYHPAIHRPKIPLKALPFACATSTGFPSFDDSGITWVPPAGTAVCLLFQNGDRDSAFYIGSIWNRNRGNPPTWAYPVKEYDDIWAGTRTGYLVGKDDETQVFPPWNTWNYNNFDTDSEKDFENDPEAMKRITYPHIYGIKTPEKAFLRWDDGDRKCNLRWKHMALQSSRGNFLIMKDDHLHPCGQWAHPSCGCGGGDASLCHDGNDQPVETPVCCQCGSQGCPGGPACPSDPAAGARCANRYFKREDECRPHKGSPTPLNAKAWLPQSGVHLQSLAGHHMEMDDSVEQPTGKPTWDLDFSFGCTDRFVGRMWLMSATGHSIDMNDLENLHDTGCTPTRSQSNWIRLLSAAGNRIELNDHTVPCSGTPIAGDERGIQMNSTSRHILYMIDKDNEQPLTPRVPGGVPINRSRNAYCLFRTGYGCQLFMNDAHSQQTADRQYLQLLAPQINNSRGAHFLHMQVVPSGPGIVYMRSGGFLVESSRDSSVEVVGEGQNPASKVIDVTGNFINTIDKAYVNINEVTLFKSDRYIILGAGTECAITPDSANQAANDAITTVSNQVAAAISGQRIPIRDRCGPCYTLPLCLDPKRGVIVFSDRVLISTSSRATCCPLQLFVGSVANRTCPPPSNASCTSGS